jgi:DNA adenine methylase
MNKIQKPFLKWAGGKTQIIETVLSKFPLEIKNYHEPFLGGGSVLLALLTKINNKEINLRGNIYASDSNESLINLYIHIQCKKDELYNCIDTYISDFNNISGEDINRNPDNITEALTSRESYYYYIRKKYNESLLGSIERSAMFLFLNKTCFRGLYREGPNGFNVPYGHYKNPSIINKDDLDNISELIKDVVFKACDFTESFKNINEGDFVYIDPPYAPENPKSFVKYTENGFDLNCHNRLFDIIKKTNDIHVKFLLSNSNVEHVKKSFETFEREELIAKRAINSKNPESVTKELLIYN